VASKAMRHILIDHIRKKKAGKRGGNHSEVTLIDEIISTEHSVEDELVQIDHALDELAKFDDRMAKIVEYRYFGDMKMGDIAEVLNLSPRTVKRDWAVARGWLYQRLKEEI
jgi:RNA polymerase sigma factor (TIGR02999 family)